MFKLGKLFKQKQEDRNEHEDVAQGSVDQKNQNELEREDMLSTLQQATIMMVDDESTTMEIMQAYLEEAGYKNFVLIEDSTKALAAIEHERPDILILDLVMPEITGFEILSHIRTDPNLLHLPVIILTSSADTDTKLKALDGGATDFLAKPVDPSELKLRVRNTIAAKAYQDQLAFYDPLTKLPNKNLFLDRLDWAIKHVERSDGNVVLLHVSFNEFDKIYKSFGPHVGDAVIKQIGERISSGLRRNDMVGRDTNKQMGDNLFRLGDNEFSVLCVNIEKVEHAAIVANRLLSIMEEPLEVAGNKIRMGASIGIASYPYDVEDISSLFQAAVSANAQAKESGGFAFYSSELNKKSCERLKMEARLQTALDNNEFTLYYQPKINVRTGQIVGVESLIRWQLPDGNFVYPDQFIPLAEENGMIVPIGEWVLKEACQQLAAWQKNKTQLQVAVNLSAKQFYGQDIYSVIQKIIKDTRIDPQFLTLELTESLLMEKPEEMAAYLDKIIKLGPKVSIDDFGTGYSSLSYLKQFPLHELKIDRSFISNVANNPEDKILVSSIIELAHNFGLSVVAEGIEEKEQLDMLINLNCDQYQGYYYSRPVPIGEFEKLLFDK